MTASLFFVLFFIAVFSKNSSVKATENLVIQPGPSGKDTYICLSGEPDCLNGDHGSETDIWLGGGANPNWSGLWQFDLSAIPAGSTINSATFSIYIRSMTGADSTNTYHKITSNWEESTVTYMTKPSFGDSIGTMHINSIGWKDMNVTNLVSDWITNGNNYGIYLQYTGGSIMGPSYSPSGDYADDTSLRPKLTINYSASSNGGPEAPVGGTEETIKTTSTTSFSKNSTQTSATTVNAGNSQMTAAEVLTKIGAQAKEPKLVVASSQAQDAILVTLLTASGALSVATAGLIFFESLATGFSIKELLVLFFNFLLSLFSFRKSRKIGYVYDATSGKPLKGAIVLIFRSSDIKLVSVKTTDRKGNFAFLVEPGQYVLSAKLRGFLFPSRIAKGSVTDAYVGQVIEVKDQLASFKIPLDPTPKYESKPSTIKIFFYSVIVRMAVLLFGTVVSAFILFLDQSMKNYLILSCYLLLWILEYIIQHRVLKASRVLDSQTKKPVDLAIVRIIGPDGKIRQTCVADNSGGVIPCAESINDRISIEREGYDRYEGAVNDEGFLEHKIWYLNKTIQ